MDVWDVSCYPLARPGAAAICRELVVAARSQRSAFSSQLLNKHRQHAFDLGGLLLELFIVFRLDQFQVSSQEKLILQLAGRASGNTAETSQLGISGPSTSFGEV